MKNGLFFTIDLIAGKQYNLTLLRDLLEQRHCLTAAVSVEIHERIVNYKRTIRAFRQRQLANGKAHGKIHKIKRARAQIFCIARNVSAGFMHRSREVAIEHDPVILSAGHELHVLGRKLAEGRRESALDILIGLAHGVDRKRYRDRNAIERMFCRLKDFRRIATRYDKLARNYLASLCLAALVSCWLR